MKMLMIFLFGAMLTTSCSHFNGGKSCCKKEEKSCCKDKKDCGSKKDCKDGNCDLKKTKK